MKKAIFSFAIILVTLTGYSQLTLPQVGLPVEVDALKNCVINSVVHTQPQISVSRTGVERVTFRTLTPGVTAYGLNFIHSYLHDYGHDFVSATNGTYIFFKPSIKFNQNGKDYHIAAQELNVYQEVTGRWVFKIKTYTKSFRLRAGRAWKDYTDEQLATLAGITVEQLHERCASYYYGFDRNPATTLTSAFVTVNQITDGTFNATLWVNLQEVNGASNRLASNDVIWRFYNDCGGQWGQCDQRFVGSGTQATHQTFPLDNTKTHIAIECAIGDPKRVDFRGYYIVKGCDIDDPCGQAQRLPRKPVQ